MDDLTHICVTCTRLSGLFQLTKGLIRKLTPTIDKIPVWWYLIVILAIDGLDVNVTRLCIPMCSYTVQSQSNIESKCGRSVCQISEHSM